MSYEPTRKKNMWDNNVFLKTTLRGKFNHIHQVKHICLIPQNDVSISKSQQFTTSNTHWFGKPVNFHLHFCCLAELEIAHGSWICSIVHHLWDRISFALTGGDKSNLRFNVHTRFEFFFVQSSKLLQSPPT